MVRLSLEQIIDIPYPSIKSFLSNEGWNPSQVYDNDLISAIIYYSNNHLLLESDRKIVTDPDFVQTFQLSNTEVIQRVTDQGKNISIFSNRVEMLRHLIKSKRKKYFGQIMTFGANDYGQLGLGYSDDRKMSTPMSVRLDDVKIVSCGVNHTAIITEEGELMTFGKNNLGQLGLGHTEDVSTPTLVSLEGKVKMVSCGETHTAIVTETGQLMTFGSNLKGRLGIDVIYSDSTRPTLVDVPGNKRIKTVSCGDAHTAIVTEDGLLMTFGGNFSGQLGLGDREDRYSPELVTISGWVKDVSCGGNHTAIITNNDNLITFGSNSYGQLGLGERGGLEETPRSVQLNVGVKTVSCGYYHTGIITTTGKVMTFGYNFYGQLGLGRSGIDEDRPKLVEIPNDEKVETISCGNSHTAIITETGELITFGSNENGQLGLQQRMYVVSPTLVNINRKTVHTVSCGGQHTAIIVES